MPYPPPDPELLRRIPLSARIILDVGCGAGALTAAYRLMNPTARLLGIDVDPDAAAAAATHMSEVATVDVEDQPLPFELPEGLDCIIYDGILEHLRDPWGLLRRHAAALNPDGMMLIRVPNVEHWTIAHALLVGRWEHAGPPVRAPLWLGIDNMGRALLQAGLVLCDVMRSDTVAEQPAARAFVEAITPALAALGIDPIGYAQRAEPRHLIWRVRREPRTRIRVSGSMLAPVGGVSHVRVMQPFQAIGTDPLVTVAITDHIATITPSDDATRIFVLHRPALTCGHGTNLLRSLIEGGYLIVTEFDDHPDFFEMMHLGGDVSFRGVHAIQTSTPALAEVLRRYNPEIAVFPNAIAALQPVRNFARPDFVTVFFGALNREQDWRPLMPAINAAAAKAGERMHFQVVHDGHFYNGLKTPHKTFTPTCDYATYLDILGGSEAPLMPLSDTPFNRAKSDLKFIEAGACRVAALASTVVYGDSIEDGRTGLLFRDPTELYDRLLRLVVMPELARGLGDAAREYVTRERMLAYQVAARIAWYRSLWQRRDVLSAALNARMTERVGAGNDTSKQQPV